MTQSSNDEAFPKLFSHRLRKEWGVSVLSGIHDGKRRYLFEGGEERTMAGGQDMMQRVDEPDRDQQHAFVRLTALLAKRDGRSGVPGVNLGALALIEQVERLRKNFTGGLQGEAWLTSRLRQAGRARGEAAQLQEKLSKKSLEAEAKSPRADLLWNDVVTLLTACEMATDQVRPISEPAPRLAMSVAVRELLHGSESYEKRFDRCVVAFELAFREPPRWETITVLPALVHPMDHIYVEPVSFRRQLKQLSRSSVLPTRPTGVAYARCLSMARSVAKALANEAEAPRDLLDVHDFIRATVSAGTRAAAARVDSK